MALLPTALQKNRVRGHVSRKRKLREPVQIETHKVALFLFGRRTNLIIKTVLSDFAKIKHPDVVQLTQKNDINPMEDDQEVDFLVKKNDAGLFLVGSHLKKRPNNLVFGRTFDGRVLDMIEVGVSYFESIVDVQKRVKSGASGLNSAAPMMVFRGEEFANAMEGGEVATLKSLLIDMFRGRQVAELDLESLDLALVFTSTTTGDGKTLVTMRGYRTAFSKKSGENENGSASGPVVSLLEHGPHVDFVLRRSRIAAPNLAKLARKQPRLSAVTEKRKNITHNKTIGKVGRLHVEREGTEKLVQRSRFRKALKKGAPKED